MTTVVLGAGGKLGRLLRPRWPGDAVWLDRSQANIDDPRALAQALKQATVIFCLAGSTNASHAPMETNITAARKALDAANGAHVFLFSSAAVYGAQQGALHENGPTSAQSPYAQAKLDMEQMATAHPNPSTVLRLGNVAGADAILGNWKPGFQLDQMADGATPARSYIGPTRLAQVLHALTQQAHPAVLNIAAPRPVQMGDLLDAADLAWTAKPATDGTIAKVHLDTTQLERLITFSTGDSTAHGIVADWQQKDTA